MDAMEVLGGLLKRHTGGSGKGGNILIDIFQQATQPGPERRTDPDSAANDPSDVGRAARELEDLLNVATRREGAPSAGPSRPQSTPQSPRGTPQQTAPAPAQPTQPKTRPAPAPAASEPGWPSDFDQGWRNEQATVLVRAMLNAAKADGEISQAEQRSILKQFDNSSPEAIQFLREEIARPLDVREFAWSVPIGMEQQVYAMSLMAIDVDARAETQYLQELAHALRLPQQICDQLQQRYEVGPVPATR